MKYRNNEKSFAVLPGNSIAFTGIGAVESHAPCWAALFYDSHPALCTRLPSVHIRVATYRYG